MLHICTCQLKVTATAEHEPTDGRAGLESCLCQDRARSPNLQRIFNDKGWACRQTWALGLQPAAILDKLLLLTTGFFLQMWKRILTWNAAASFTVLIQGVSHPVMPSKSRQKEATDYGVQATLWRIQLPQQHGVPWRLS